MSKIVLYIIENCTNDTHTVDVERETRSREAFVLCNFDGTPSDEDVVPLTLLKRFVPFCFRLRARSFGQTPGLSRIPLRHVRSLIRRRRRGEL